MIKRTPQERADLLAKQLSSPLFRSRLRTFRALRNLSPQLYTETYEKAKGGARQMARVRDMLKQGMTVEDIARQTGVAHGTVKNWIYGRGVHNALQIAHRKSIPGSRTDPHWGDVFGSALVQGHVRRSHFELSSTDSEFAKRTVEAHRKVSGEGLRLRVNTDGYGRGRSPNPVYYFRSHNKAMMERIAAATVMPSGERALDRDSLTREQEVRALQMIFDGGGSLVDETRHLKSGKVKGLYITVGKYTEKYGMLIGQIQKMLAEHGVLSNTFEVGKSSVLTIKGLSNLENFSKNVGFRTAGRQERLERWLKNPQKTLREYTVDDYYGAREYVNEHPDVGIAKAARATGVTEAVLGSWLKSESRPENVKLYEKILAATPEEARNRWSSERSRLEQARDELAASVIPIRGMVDYSTINQIGREITAHKGFLSELERAMETASGEQFKKVKEDHARVSWEIEELRRLHQQVKAQVKRADAVAEPEYRNVTRRRSTPRQAPPYQ